MSAVIPIFKQTIKQLYHNAGLMVGLSVFWFFSSFAVLTIGPVTAGVYYVFNRVAQSQPVVFSDIWLGIRSFWKKGLLLFLIYFFFLGTAFGSIHLALDYDSLFFAVIAFVWMYVVLFGLMTLLYVFPLLVQTDDSIPSLIRQAGIIVFDNFIFSLGALIANSIVIAFFTLFPPLFVLFCFGFVALLGNNLLKDRLEIYE